MGTRTCISHKYDADTVGPGTKIENDYTDPDS